MSPLLIERCLIDVDGIDDAIVVEHEGAILGIVCVPDHQNPTTIVVSIPKRYHPKRWIVLKSAFPLTDRNKRSRQWIKSYALRHFAPTTNLLSDLLPVDTIDAAMSLFASGVLDSIALLDVVSRIEQHWSIRFSWSDVNLDNLDSLEKMVNFIARKQQG